MIKISQRLGEDLWMVQGIGDGGKYLDATISPTTLDNCLKTLTPENGWVLCEFPEEIAFYATALIYLLQSEDT